MAEEHGLPEHKGWLVKILRVWTGRVTFTLLLAALVVGITGLIRQSGPTDYHLLVETLAVLAGITGVYAERRAAAAERRHTAIWTVRKELEDNIKLLEKDARFEPQDGTKPEPRLYPRVDVTAADACLAQGALADDDDGFHAKVLASWRERAETFNRGLNLIELLFYGLQFTTVDTKQVITEIDEELQEKRSKMATETHEVQSALK